MVFEQEFINDLKPMPFNHAAFIRPFSVFAQSITTL